VRWLPLLLLLLCGPLAADVVVTRDGRRLVGEVLRKDGRVIVRMKLGSVVLDPKDILRIEPDAGFEAEFDKRKAALTDGDRKARLALADWARERGLHSRALGLYRQMTAVARARQALVEILLTELIARPRGAQSKSVKQELADHAQLVASWLGARYTSLSAELAARITRQGEPDLSACVARYKEQRRQLLALVRGAGFDDRASVQLRDRALSMYRLLKQLYSTRTVRPFVVARHRARLEELTRIESLALELGASLPGAASHEAELDKLTGLVDRAAIDKALGLGSRARRMARTNKAFAGVDRIEADLVGRINRYRDMLGLSVLRLEMRLCLASNNHTRVMLDRQFFAHLSPVRGQREPSDRVSKVRYPWRLVGEVLARKSRDPQAVFRAFLHSPTHHRTLLHPEFREIGIGKIKDYWTLELARRR